MKIREIYKILCEYISLYKYYIFGFPYPDKRYYKYFHDTHSDICLNLNRKKKIIFVCDGIRCHGGLTDRLKGILSTFIESEKYGCDFFIHWVHPFNITDYLSPASNIDWRINQSDIKINYKTGKPLVFSEDKNKIRNKIQKFFFKKLIKEKKDNIVYTNIVISPEKYANAYKRLFKPAKALQSRIIYHLNNLGADYWSFSFRFGNLLGDFKDVVGTPLNEKDRLILINKNIKELLTLIKLMPKGFRAFITSDSYTYLTIVKNLDDRIYIIDEPINHPDYFSSNKENNDAWMKLFLDQNIIMKAKKVFLLKTDNMYKSGFAECAAVIGNKEFILHEF